MNKNQVEFGSDVKRLPVKDLLKRIGPGLVATGIVIGPGAVTTSAMLGADYGYALIWLIIPIIFMGITFMMTTNRLANRCGISQSFLRSVERNEKGISVASLSIVCDELGLSLKAFFDVPGEAGAPGDDLLRQIEQLTAEQRKALAAFLDAMTKQPRD